MEEVGAQVASPMFIHPTLAGRFCEGNPMAKKRSLPFQAPNVHYHHHQQPQLTPEFQSPGDSWNLKDWEWDSVRFMAKPSESEVLHPRRPLESEVLHPHTARTFQSEQHKRSEEESSGNPDLLMKTTVGEDDESLRLDLGGSLNSVEEPLSRPNKRVRSGSPGGGSDPMCQVDNCREDLSNAKDYHRRHKACEVHSKSTKALVGRQM